MVVQKLSLEEELTNFTASSMVHPSFEGLPTFTDALSKDKGQAFLFFGMAKVGVLRVIITLELYYHFKFYLR
jgi:hypothetical protein